MKCPEISVPFAIGAAASVLLTIGTSAPARAGDYSITLDGSPIYERLDSNDNYLSEDNSYYDTYTFTGRAGQRVIITMSSQEIDAYLILVDPNGNSIAQDDDGGGNLDAQINVVLPVNGTYTIYANTYTGGITGPYSIQATTSSSPPLASNTVNSPTPTLPRQNQPSASTQPRYFCDSEGDVPLTMARSRRTGNIFPLIRWVWAPAPYTTDERCQIVSERFEEIHNRFDRLILTAGTLNGQPVVCAASNTADASQGICAEGGLVLTAQNRTEAEDLILGLQTNFTRIVAGTDPEVLPAGTVRVSNDGIPYVNIGDF